MGSFANRYIDGFSDEELMMYDAVLGHPDPDLYNWITGAEPVPANFMNPVMALLVRHQLQDDSFG